MNTSKGTVRCHLVLAGLAAGWAAYPALAQPYRFAAEDLGTLTDRTSVATALADETAYVAGFSAISGNFSGEPWFMHACLWDGTRIRDLGVLGPDVPPNVFPKPESRGQGVNQLAHVVGRSAQPGQPWRPFLWLPSPAFGMPAGINPLPELPGGASAAMAINASDWIAGESRPPGSLGPHPVLWRYAGGQWTITDLGTLGGPYGRATALNDAGQIVGQANVPGGDMHAFLWLPQPAYGLPAGMHDFAPGLGQAIATAVNERGQIVGYAGAGASFLWLPEPAYGLPAGTTMLSMSGVPNAAGAWPAGINDDGEIVGQVAQYFPHDRTEFHAFYWSPTDHTMWLLEGLLPPGTPWWLVNAAAIDRRGHIAAHGTSPAHPEMSHAAVLRRWRPCDINCDGTSNFADINPFVLALSDPAGYWAAYPDCNIYNADINGDGLVDFDDINAFVDFCMQPR
ncbi:MAG: hypothetical protein AB1716_00620 [Planctomycetota bacterium]